MATVAEKYALPRFTAYADGEALRAWAREASLEDLRLERLRMTEMRNQFPRYRKLIAWLEDIADLRGLELSIAHKA